MTATYDPLTADEVYSSGLEPPVRSRGRRVFFGALDLWCAMTGGLLELTRAADVVVRRRSDGGEELRVSAGPPPASLPVLEQVRDDLAELSPEEFRDAWGID